jgi:hypothetical protein
MSCAPIHAVLSKLRLAAVNGAISFRESMDGCRVAGFGPVACTPCCFEQFPATPANEVANTIVRVWPAEYSSTLLSQSLGACKNPATQAPAFDATTIAAASEQAVSLVWCASGHTADACHELGLFQGDVTHMKANAENVDYLVVSCLPGDYNPSPGSMMAALLAIGVNVATLAQNKAADYRTTHSCWISQPIANQAFARLVVFESTGAAAPGAIPGVFAGIQQFQPSPPLAPNPGVTLTTTLLSTGAAGGDPNAVLTALFNAAMASIDGGYNLLGVRIDVYQQAWVTGLTTLFNQLKQQHGLQ